MVVEYGKLGEGGQRREMLEELRKQCQVVFQEQCQKFVEEMLQQWEERFLEPFAEKYLQVSGEQYQGVIEENAVLREELVRVNGTWEQAAEQERNNGGMEGRLAEDFEVQEGKQAKEIEVQNDRADNLEKKVGSRKGARDVDKVGLENRSRVSEKKMGEARVSGTKELMEGRLKRGREAGKVKEDGLVKRRASGIKGARSVSKVDLRVKPRVSKEGKTGEWGVSGERVLLPLEVDISGTEWREQEKKMGKYTWPEEKIFPEFEEYYEAIARCVKKCLDKGVPDEIVADSLHSFLLKAPSAGKYATFSQHRDVETTAGVLGALRETNFEYCNTTSSERFQKLALADGEDLSTFMARLLQAYKRFNKGVDIENDSIAKRHIKKRFFEGSRVPESISRGLRACDRLSDIVWYTHVDMEKLGEQDVRQAEAGWWGQETHPPPLMQGVFY